MSILFVMHLPRDLMQIFCPVHHYYLFSYRIFIFEEKESFPADTLDISFFKYRLFPLSFSIYLYGREAIGRYRNCRGISLLDDIESHLSCD